MASQLPRRWRRAVPHRSVPFFAVLLAVSLPVGAAVADELRELVGKWRWQDFTIEVVECKAGDVCAKVVAGPKNVGLDLFASKLTAKGNDWFGQIAHPETKEVYNTRFQRKDKDHWRLDGCTTSRVCLTGEFVRVK
jgi:uncharacterized protein (DUF2147 family)